MKTRTLALALTLVVIVVAISATYVLAHPGSGNSYYGVTGNTDDLEEEWWDEMREHMEEHWEELEDNDYYRYGRSSHYGGYGRYGGCHW